ncbi:condensation domain-containing protein [Kitasatospora sp. NBC_01539]
MLEPADLTAHCLLTWTITGDLDHGALEDAVADVHRRHEPLHSGYFLDPAPHARPTDIPPPLLDVLPDRPDTAAAVRALRTELADELALDEGEVWRTALVPVRPAGAPDGPRTAVFGCVVHHIAFDGWSESVLARHLADAYAERTAATVHGPQADAEPPRPAPGLAEVHAERLRHARHAGPRDRHESYLRDELKGLPALPWPSADGTRDATGPGRVEARLTAAQLAGVDALATDAGTTRFGALLAHWAAALAETTGARDFGVGVPVAQRDSPILAGAVGCHIEMLCLRLRGTALDGGTTGARETGRTVARALAAQDVPFADVLRLTEPRRTGRPPLYQVLFALQDNAAPRLGLPGLHTAFLRQPYLELPLELHTELWPDDDGGMRLEVAFRPDAVAESTARELADRFTGRLTAPAPHAAPLSPGVPA